MRIRNRRSPDLNLAELQERDRRMQEIEVRVHPALLEAFVDFVDKIEAAIAAKE